jgi:hypothetical protein
VPLPVTASATSCFPAFAILVLIGDVLVAWDVSHKPLTLPRIKELLDDGEDINILPLIHELYLKMWHKTMKYCSFFSLLPPQNRSAHKTFLMRTGTVGIMPCADPVPTKVLLFVLLVLSLGKWYNETRPISLRYYFLLSIV